MKRRTTFNRLTPLPGIVRDYRQIREKRASPKERAFGAEKKHRSRMNFTKKL
ncbi:hypothetical protein GCM10007924_03320 [Sneathiella chinensis]|uniref:Uncharacterized protein n=1 Tax=Sneathiella chinensis TaxID=349750 RepID=A0ABQ5U3N7_9PROT|nr:hypothetical protein GCM10007924_03320 [Sneathiella chinensis]